VSVFTKETVTLPDALPSVAALRTRLRDLEISFPLADIPFAGGTSTLAGALTAGGVRLSNRLVVIPGLIWDGTAEGDPTTTTRERWERLARLGPGCLIGANIAVSDSGRAHARQLLPNLRGLSTLVTAARAAHKEHWGDSRTLTLGIQVSHAGRWSVSADGRPCPLPAFSHPLLDPLSGPAEPLTDEQLEEIAEQVIRAAHLAWNAGFELIDLDHGNGHLFSEILAAHSRAGRYGGSLGARTRLLRRIVAGIRAEAPGLLISVHLSLFDRPPGSAATGGPHFRAQQNSAAVPPHRLAFGVSATDPVASDPSEPIEVFALLRTLGVRLITTSIGSPHYSPQIYRPGVDAPPAVATRHAPPSAAEDPLIGVARHIHATHALAAHFPDLCCIGSGLTSLGRYLPHVASALIERQWLGAIGLDASAANLAMLAAALIGSE
jgi:2,4-dienoyl-CoA reductase-like NADH-dependent reductase (Old Yellow Enzyme family)